MVQAAVVFLASQSKSQRRRRLLLERLLNIVSPTATSKLLELSMLSRRTDIR